MDPHTTLTYGMWSVLAQSLIFGLVLTAAVQIALRMVAPANASTRFAVWFVALVTIAILPPVFFVRTVIPGLVDRSAAKPQAAPRKAAELPAVPVAKLVTATEILPAAPEVTRPAVPPVRTPFQPTLSIPSQLASALLWLYAFTAAVLLFGRLGVSYLRLRRLKADTWQAPPEVMSRFEKWLLLSEIRRPVELLLSSKARSPIAVGFRTPAVILPDSLLLRLTGEELDHLGVHELAHVRRYDDWTNLAQRILQAVLFFHPAVHWICRKLEFEREVACDDQVLTLMGTPKPYAQVLATVLEYAPWQRSPILASGAAFRKRQIFRRIEMLLDRSRDSRPNISYVTLAVIVICLFGAFTQIVKMSPMVAFRDTVGRNHSSWSFDGRKIEAEFRGDIQFADDDISVQSISPGGYLRISEGGWTRRELELRPGSSSRPDTRYIVDGRERPLDAAGREWAESTIAFLIRETGINAEQRALRILDRRGPSGVLEEIDRIMSDHSRQKYLAAVIQSGKLNTDDLRRAIGRVRRIGSDYDKANLLLEVARLYALVPLRTAYFDAVNSIASDHDRGRVLARVIEESGSDSAVFEQVGDSVRKMASDHEKAVLLQLPAVQNAAGSDPVPRRSLLRAVASVQSDHEKAAVLSTMLQTRPAPAEELENILRVVATIQSDHEKSQVLGAAITRQDLNPPAVQAAFYGAAGTVQSASDRARVLNLLIDRDLSGGIVDELARSIEQIGSDHDKAGVLVKLASKPVTPAYLKAVRSINSDSDKRRVIEAMVARGNAATSAVELAGTINSDHDKSQVLSAIAEKHGSDPEVHNALRKAAEKLSSDSDYRRIMSKLFADSGERRQ